MWRLFAPVRFFRPTHSTPWFGPVCLTLLLAACATITPEGEVVLSTQAGSTLEVESLAVVSVSGGTQAVSSDGSCSASKCAFFNARPGGQITYRVEVPRAGRYSVGLRVKNWNARGIFQLATAESPSGAFSSRGSAVNQYSPSARFVNVSVGEVSFASAGSKGFRFSVTGKDSRSGGYTLALDSLTLTPAGTASEPPTSGWKRLFNGYNLDGWNTYLTGVGLNSDPKGVFKVEDGLLHLNDIPATSARQPFGYLVTKSSYRDYHLRFQYRWGSKRFSPRESAKRDSGVIYHASSSDKVWPSGAELQVQEGDTGDFWLIGGPTLSTTVASTSATPQRYREGGVPYTTRSGSFVQLARNQARDSLSGWNTVELIVRGNEATHIVNGSVVNRGTLRDSGGNPLSRGRILFQVEGAEVYYRNIEIRALGSATPTEPEGTQPGGSGRVVLFDGSSNSAWRPKSSGGQLWPVRSGALEVVPGSRVSANDIQTKETFGDFKMHLEFQVPSSPSGTTEQSRGNSGIYLQGRYELQVLDSYRYALSGANDAGAIYGVKDASRNVSRAPGSWQSFDITFRAAKYSGSRKVSPAYVTVYWNGTRVHYGTAISRSTTLGAPEGPSRGPILLQDHGDKVRYRNIWIEPLN